MALAALVHGAAPDDPLYAVLARGANHYNAGERATCRAEYRACLECLQLTALPSGLKAVVDDALAREQGEPTDEDAAFLLRGAIDKVRKGLKTAKATAACACTSPADCTCGTSCNCANCGTRRAPAEEPLPGPGYVRDKGLDGKWGPWRKMAAPQVNYTQPFAQSAQFCAGSS